MPIFLQVLLGAGAGLLSGVAGNAIASKLAPGSTTAAYGAGALGVIGGAMVARKRPILGAAIATGSLVATIGSWVTFKLQMLTSSPADKAALQNAQTAAIGALQQTAMLRGMGGLTKVAQLQAVTTPTLGAVFADNLHGMGAVFADNLAGMGDDDEYMG